MGVDLGAIRSQPRHRGRALLYGDRSNFADCASTRASRTCSFETVSPDVQVWGRLLSSKGRNEVRRSLIG